MIVRGLVYSEPIEMAGFRALRVEASLLADLARPCALATLVVEGSNDFTSEKKTWAWKGQAMNLNPGAYVVGDYAETGSLARVRLDVPEGVPLKHVRIRLTRLD